MSTANEHTDSRWYHRVMRFYLPLGMAWLVFGVVALGVEIASSSPSAILVGLALTSVAGGAIFIVGWWAYRREQADLRQK